MAVNTNRDYDAVSLPNAASTTRILRGAVGQDSADNTDLPIEKFLEVEATGLAVVEHSK